MFGSIVRRAMDEVIDCGRTRRVHIDELSSPEKAYIGTKVEIISRDRLGFPEEGGQDVLIADHPVNIKWSKSSRWMIGPENIGKICLIVGLDGTLRRFRVGAIVAFRGWLCKGKNRDAKVNFRAWAIKEFAHWIVEDAPVPPSFMEELDKGLRDFVFAGKSAQERADRFAEKMIGVPLPRHALVAAAGGDNDDPTRRFRLDSYRKGPPPRYMMLYTGTRKRLLAALGYSNLPAKHWVSVWRSDIDALFARDPKARTLLRASASSMED